MKKLTIKGRKGIIECTESTMAMTDIHLASGQNKVNLVIKDIFDHLAKKGIEESMKFEFTDTNASARFKWMCTTYRNNNKLHVHIGSTGNHLTVFIYNKEDSI